MTVGLIIVGLILINALYVAAEFAAVGVRHGQIRKLAQEGNRLARRLLPILQDAHRLDRYIAACQIGITLSSLVLGAYGQATLAVSMAPLFESWGGMQEVAAQSAAAIVALIGLTALQVVFGELVPKSLALQFPVRMALLTYLPMRWSLVAYTWFIKVLNGSGLFLLKLLGVSYTGHRHIHSPEEIDMLIAESRDGGLLEPDEQERLHRALQLSRQTARELMVPRQRVMAVDVTINAEALLDIAIEGPYTRLPVYDGSIDNIVGLIHMKDLVARYIDTDSIASPRELLRPISAVPDTLTADRLLAMMRERHVQLAVVLDEFGGMQGIVTLEDVIRELLGDVADEFKGEQVEPEHLPDGSVRIPGHYRLADFAQLTDLHWHSGASTIGGHVLSVLGRVPNAGEVVAIDGVDIRIEQMRGQAIAWLVLTPNTTGKEV